MLPIIPKKEPLYNAHVALFILLKRIYNTLKQLLSLIAPIVVPLLGTHRKDLKKSELIKVSCPHCHEVYEVKLRYETYYESFSTQDSGLQRDDVFGLPYYLQENVRGHLFWAKNITHLLLMEDYIASDLREREGMTMVAKLPTFIKLKKNRALLLKILRRWKEQL